VARAAFRVNGALPAAIEDISRALGLVRPRVTRLSGGVANESFRLQDGTRDYVLKLAGGAAARLGSSRRAEVAMQSLAAGEGLAPRIVLVDQAGRCVVSEFVAGRAPLESEMRDPAFLARVGAWCARLHALGVPAGIMPVDFGSRAAGYLARIPDVSGSGVVPRLRRELERRRAALPRPATLVPCHHDLHRRNLVDDGARLVAVDWEYAGPGDPAADLAACARYHGLDTADIEALAGGYGGADAGFRARIASVAWIFDCLWYGWNAVAAQEGLAVDAEEQSWLAARLLG